MEENSLENRIAVEEKRLDRLEREIDETRKTIEFLKGLAKGK